MPHCSLATLIGLCIRVKIERNIQHKLKLDIYIKKGAHTTEDESKYDTNIENSLLNLVNISIHFSQ